MFEWYQALIVFGVAFAVVYCTVPLSKKIAVRIGAVDYPSDRRMNSSPIPRCGGISLYAGVAAACAVMAIGVHFLNWRILAFSEMQGINYVLLFIGISIMFAVGLADDITQLSPVIKLGGQVVSACVVVAAGISIGVIRSPFGEGFIDLEWLSFPITVIYLVAFVNVINLIDGLDGLAAGTVAIVASGLLYLIALRGASTFVLICIALISSCVAFLRYNYSPASVFMGDSGSLFLGLMIGVISISGVVRTQSLIAMLVPVVMAGVPILDTLSAIIRRMRGHQPIQQADVGHIHHRLMDAGLGQRKSVFILYCCSAALVIIGCFLGSMHNTFWMWVIIIALAVVLFFVIKRFGLFRPVLRHYFVNKGARGPRKPFDEETVAEKDSELP